MYFIRRHPKVFVIGRNKTGTTSIADALVAAGFTLGGQSQAELLVDDWIKRDFRRIIRYCRKADAFQDVPFSMPYTYQAMDQAFSGAKFVLSVRSSGAEWYESLVRFHTKLLGKSRVPTADDLKSSTYVRQGWLWRQQQVVYGVDEKNLYDRELYIAHYEQHNADVKEYFRYRSSDLLVVNLADADAASRLDSFLGLPTGTMHIRHLNKSCD